MLGELETGWSYRETFLILGHSGQTLPAPNRVRQISRPQTSKLGLVVKEIQL